MAGHLRDTAALDADRRQDPLGPGPAGQSLVAGAALCDRPRLTTPPMPYGPLSFQIDFDFIDHRLVITTSEGRAANMALEPRSVADFHRDLMAELKALGIVVKIWTMPVEIPDAIPFEQDRTHAAYDRDYANRFWRILVQCDRIFTVFRSRFIGKVSPVHFFWGSFDLAVTRFSGRAAPPHPGVAPNLAN